MAVCESLEKRPRPPIASESAQADADLPVFGARSVIVAAANAYPSLKLVDPVTGHAIDRAYDAMEKSPNGQESSSNARTSNETR